MEDQKPSNQVAELTAILKACEIARKHHLSNIIIATDSKYCADAINKWLDVWKTNGWKDNRGKSVTNQVLLP